MAILGSQPSSIGWRFWVHWMVGTIAGAAVYVVAAIALNVYYLGAVGLITGGNPVFANSPLWIGLAALHAGLMGALFGLGQWLVMRRYLPRSGWWVLATSIGYAIAASSGMIYDGPSELGTVLVGLEFGIVLGVLQWLVLRNRVYRAGWWIPITLVGWALAFAPNGAAYLSGLHIEPMDMLFTSLVPVAVGGAGMVWLLRRSAQRDGPPFEVLPRSSSV